MKSSSLRYAQLSLAAGLLAAPMALMPACDGSNPLDTLCCSSFKPGTNMLNVDWGLEGEVNAQFGVTMQAVGDLSGAATAMLTDLGTLCRNMAVELGEDPKSVTTTDPQELTTQWCSKAAAKVAEVSAAGNITVSFQPAQCSFSAEVQASCEGSCQVDASCDPGSVEVRCDPGELSVKCEGSCSGSCEGSATVAVNCSGTCSGECEGTCSGTQNGSQCDGTCEGKCRGSCSVDAPDFQCDGECKGGCEGTATAPKCTGKLEPPTCDVNADCQASCDASASAKAECTPPAVSVVGAAEFGLQIAVLKKYLPEIVLIAEKRAQLLLEAADGVVSAAANIEGDLSAEAALCIVPAALAIGDAASNLTVSVSASGSVMSELQ